MLEPNFEVNSIETVTRNHQDEPYAGMRGKFRWSPKSLGLDTAWQSNIRQDISLKKQKYQNSGLLEEMSADNQNQWDSSSGEHERHGYPSNSCGDVSVGTKVVNWPTNERLVHTGGVSSVCGMYAHCSRKKETSFHCDAHINRLELPHWRPEQRCSYASCAAPASSRDSGSEILFFLWFTA